MRIICQNTLPGHRPEEVIHTLATALAQILDVRDNRYLDAPGRLSEIAHIAQRALINTDSARGEIAANARPRDPSATDEEYDATLMRRLAQVADANPVDARTKAEGRYRPAYDVWFRGYM